MLRITVSGTEAFDESKDEFVIQGGFELELEHSLVSLSKWEITFEKPFLSKEEKSAEEVIAYIQCMCVTPDVPPEVFQGLQSHDFKAINEYIDAKMSATWFSDPPGAPQTKRIITSELIYYWMTAFHIPFECEHWHLNRLFNLIRICNIEQATKPQKMSQSEIAARNRELNAKRRQQLGTTG